MGDGKLDLILMWHMHQPDYRDHARGEFALPWVYLHAVKDYVDMVAHLERHPRVRAAVNFVPALLDQIEDYAQQFRTGEWRDPLLRLLACRDMAGLDAASRKLILASCFRSNHLRMVAPFPHYKRLHDLYTVLEEQGEAALGYLSGAYLSDLITWYHLAWTGETERRRQPLLAQLMAKGEGFTDGDRQRLLALLGELIEGIAPRYAALARAGRIELSTTPATHPLAPLLIDFAVAREAQPDAGLPQSPCYSGGRARVAAQLVQALASHAARFGMPAAGVWPAEGALSSTLLHILSEHPVAWTASSESVLANSLRREGGAQGAREHFLYRPYRVAAAPGVAVFFRDERLSDLIAFEYSKWHGRDAAHHFIAQLEAIRAGAPPGETPLVTVIVDGENAWEYYPYNAYYFFEDLYGALESHPVIRTTTPAVYLSENPERAGELGSLVAGSWVYGTFSTWIGDADKNRAWDLLCAAKQSYDLVVPSGRLSERERASAEAQLAVCESSDWFWWFGNYNPPHTVATFDRLYRLNLTNLYAVLELAPPAQLLEPVSRGGGSPEAGGTMRRAH
ncbi:MAG: glycoside hydrolase [Betaproteobacteria bacterium]|nr:glycoside hydrolase [Betaproteobacteria bacterium]